MTVFLSEKQLYPIVYRESARARDIFWVCSPYLGKDSHQVFSQKIMETPPEDIRFIFKLNRLSVKRGEVNPYEVQYFLEHFRESSIKKNDTFHSKIYIFDDSAIITSANLSKRAFERNIEVGVLLKHEQVRKAKSFFRRLWEVSEAVGTLDDYKNEWNKTKADRETSENRGSKKTTKRHTKIQPWNENIENEWFMHVTAETSKKTERKIRRETQWTDDLDLMTDLKLETYESLRLGDIVYVFQDTGRDKDVVEFEEGRVKDKRKIETTEGNYHFVYQKKPGFSLEKRDFDRLIEKVNVDEDDEEVLFDKRQAVILEKGLDDLASASSKETIRQRVHRYLTKHPNEVFEYRDRKMKKDLADIKPNDINWTLWNLEKGKEIGKIRIRNRVYFGCPEAIARLRKQ